MRTGVIIVALSQFLFAQFDSRWFGRSTASLAAEFRVIDETSHTYLVSEDPQVYARVIVASPYVRSVEFAASGQFPDAVLWDILDAHSEGAYWEDVSLLNRQSLPMSLDAAYRKEAYQYWALVNQYKIPAVAELVHKNGRSYLRVTRTFLNMVGEPSPPFKWSQEWNLEDFYGKKDDCQAGCVLSHVATPKLSLEIEGINHHISLKRNLESPLTVPEEFKKWSAEKQLDFIRATQIFFKEERRWILKNLVPTISHWQNWASWDYTRSFKTQKTISSRKILEWGLGGGGAKEWVVFEENLAGHQVTWTTDLHGHYSIKIH